MSITTSLNGISGILVTPFDKDHSIDPSRLIPIIDKSVEAGVHILTINGNTSEFYALRGDEAERMVYDVAELINNRVPLIGGVGRSVHEACALTKASVLAGVDAIMVHQPPDPFVSPRGLIKYVSQVAEAANETPVVLYLRNDAIGTDFIVQLCEIENVIGVKWASPAPLKLAEALLAAPEEIIWVCGLAEVWAPPLYSVGARGFTSGLINIWPERSVAIHSALDAGDFNTAQHLINGMRLFEDIRAEEMGGTNVSGVKSALKMMGLDCGPVRPPSAWPLEVNQKERLKDFLKKNKLKC